MEKEKPFIERSFWSRSIGGLTGLTPRALVIAFILLSISFIVSNIIEARVGYTSWDIPFFTVVTVMAVVHKFLGVSLSLAEWAVIITLGAFSHSIMGWFMMGKYQVFPFSYYASFYQWGKDYWSLFPDFLIPKNPEVMDVFLYGGKFDLGPWIPAMAYWITLSISLLLSLFFFQLIFRRHFIERERYVFPLMTAIVEVLKYSEGIDRPSIWSPRRFVESKLFWIGFLWANINLLSEMINEFSWWGAGFEIPIPSIPLITTGLDLAPYLVEVLPGGMWYMGRFSLVWYPPAMVMVAAAAFAPLDVLITASLFGLIFQYIVPIAGVLGGLFDKSGAYWGLWTGWYYEEAGYWGFLIDHGGIGGWFYGLGIATILLARKDIIRTLKMALKGAPREENEVFSWRTTYIAWIILAAISITLMTMAWVPITLAIYTYLMSMVSFLAVAWVLAQFGFCQETWYSPNFVIDAGAALGYWSSPPGGNVPAAFQTAAMNRFLLHFTVRQVGYSTVRPMSAFKLGHESGASSRAIGVAYIIFLVVTIGIFTPISLWYYGNVGINNWAENTWYGGWPGRDAGAIWSFLTSTTPEQHMGFDPYPGVIAGIILCVITAYLHSRFAWFFIDPVGVLLGADNWHWGGMAAEMAFITWGMTIVRYLVMKFGGAKVYRKYYVPFMLGWMVGGAYYMTIQCIPYIYYTYFY